MSTSQTEFTNALLDPALAVPADLTDPHGRPAGKRFAVYRNNVAVSLTEALQASFPVVRALVGDDFFDAMAGVFLRLHPPTSPLLMLYGQELPDFLEQFQPVLHLGYLPDVARLELALRESYHAADSAPVAAEDLLGLAPDHLMRARFLIAPAARLVRSRFPIASIWHANNDPSAAKPQMGPEDALVVRPEFDPLIRMLPPGGGALVQALMSGSTLGDAVEAAETKARDFNLTDTLALLIGGQAIVGIDQGGQSQP